MAALLPRHLIQRNVKDARRGRLVDVLAVAEGLDHVGLAAQGRDDAEFDLRVIGREQDVVLVARNERLADLAAAFGADGNVLQIRVV